MERLSEYEVILSQKESFIFDLDGTLFDEWEYLSCAYRAIGIDVEERYQISGTQIYEFLKEDFVLQGRQHLFNRLLAVFQLPEEYLDISINILRTVRPPQKIPSFYKMQILLKKLLAEKKGVYIVTNGNSRQQRNKIENIEFQIPMSNVPIVYANEIKPKPDPAAFAYLQTKYQLSNIDSVMIGDSDVDAAFAKACKIDFIPVHSIL